MQPLEIHHRPPPGVAVLVQFADVSGVLVALAVF
ncbi:hypothetical protein FBZ98_1135 [Rhizobium sp. ERR 922]|nr:hypothetical protein FBZ98_1135 [Rhizobium sp. ERR 922]TWB90768.1 hypothetical protein FBZ97_1085 [Rhizobium sp. ERR 942]